MGIRDPDQAPHIMDASSLHTPVMLERCLELLAPAASRDGAVVADATLGMGGHAEQLLERHPGMTLVGIDRDPDAIRLAGERLARFGDRVRIVRHVYDELEESLADAGVDRLDGILFDLGVSSLQLDDADRGFAYAKDAPLDMRMGQEGPTAADLLATLDERELARIMQRYGDERLAGRYAKAIVRERQQEPIVMSSRLVDILDRATPAAARKPGHVAKRVFQALRIVVNDELGVLERAIPAALDALEPGGRIVVMAYQSLEDRIVKSALREATTDRTPLGVPAALPEHAAPYRLLLRGAELADDDERARNPRSIPVRLRAAERIEGAA
ncbi:16S rRNA (cytosine1402-N4)-methyltransferase [Agrococcus jejuensis]|uniref:Ribosomal RNA small subunit methyltransferase H n=2 Tax=Agrococcus jejuensis TaxID=399736 RepID=A0A1G8AAU0_9MICO|nr:16S rRNA (cytosine1402-N4)-methyltransferase [Agrococcus jejuensis]